MAHPCLRIRQEMITVLIAENQDQVKKLIAELLERLGNTSIFIRRQGDIIEVMENADIRSRVTLKDKVMESGDELFREHTGMLYKKFLELFERPLLEFVLERTEGNQIKAARILGLNRNTLRAKIKRLGINADQWKVY